MKRTVLIYTLLWIATLGQSQDSINTEKLLSIAGMVTEINGSAIPFATVTLHQASDHSLIKVEHTDENGLFTFSGIENGQYILDITYLGMAPYKSPVISTSTNNVNLDPIVMNAKENLVEEVVITGLRPIIEIQADRTVFNVQGTINAAGDNGIELLRKAPGIVLDNNENIIMMGRTGTLIYIDGKQLMLSGDDLNNYLKNLTAEQIDRIDIITNPGSKYDAQGNAGIIDIRLKKDKNLGTNGSVSTSLSHGRYGRANLNANGNMRTKRVNVFGNAGTQWSQNWNEMEFINFQNGIILKENHNNVSTNKNINFRVGTDVFLNKKSTLGFMVSGLESDIEMNGKAFNRLSNQMTPDIIDSILIASTTTRSPRKQYSYNVNYAYTDANSTLNIDLDYATFNRKSNSDQPNRYFNSDQTELLTEVLTSYSSPNTINLAIGKVDYEKNILGGRLGLGSKISSVKTDNTFLFYNTIDSETIRDDRRSNRFVYTEQVNAAYVNFTRPLAEKWNMSAGLRMEHTDASGELNAFEAGLEEDPVLFNYFSWFPSLGFTYKAADIHTYSLNYSRRINRPDYKVLNPFREQLSELAFNKGNPFLQPEISDNIELNYVFMHRYNVKLAYSQTSNKIARLVSPDKEDPRAGFITWDNLANQQILGLNFAIPVQITKWWDGFFNINTSYIYNEAVYENAVIDLGVFTYNIFQQQVFSLPGQLKVELSSWYAGPGIWEGIMRTEPNYAINIGIQRKFWSNRINVRLNASDVFFTSQWRGSVDFNGLVGNMRGAWDSRRVNLSVSYDFGNKNAKVRKRQTGFDEESKRVQE